MNGSPDCTGCSGAAGGPPVVPLVAVVAVEAYVLGAVVVRLVLVPTVSSSSLTQETSSATTNGATARTRVHTPRLNLCVTPMRARAPKGLAVGAQLQRGPQLLLVVEGRGGV